MAEAPKRPPKDPKKERFRGAVFVEKDRCKGCAFCVEFCPYGALELAPDYNVKGYHPPVLAHPDQCNGCDLCGLYCPDFAIFALRYNNPEYAGKVKPEATVSPVGGQGPATMSPVGGQGPATMSPVGGQGPATMSMEVKK